MGNIRTIDETQGGKLVRLLAKEAGITTQVIYKASIKLALCQYFNKLRPHDLRQIGDMAFTIRLKKLKRGEL